MPTFTFTLTPSTYFTRPPHWISNSMISTYLKSPALYKKMYIDKTITFNVTDPMKKGSIVDDLLTLGKTQYSPKVLKKDDPDLFEMQKDMDPEYIVSPATYDQALDIVAHVKSQPYWKKGIRSAKFQETFYREAGDQVLCGMADRIDKLPTKNGIQRYRLSDLKVTSAMKVTSPHKWFWNCQEMGYFRQLALYRYLFAHQQGIPELNITCHHTVVCYVQEGLVESHLFDIPESILNIALVEVFQALENIKCERFEDPKLSWKDSIDLEDIHNTMFALSE